METTLQKRIHGNTGKVRTPETLKKMSIASCARTDSRKHTPEGIKNISESKKGAKNPSWKGGITPKNVSLRKSVALNAWRKEVFARDNFTCQKCHVKNGYLQAHHINNFSSNPELREVLANGITFCRACHRLFHKIFGIKDNNHEQLLKFIN